jgi:hypothetical protein
VEVEEMKTNELTGAALDWAVAKCEGIDLFETEGWLYDHDTGTRKPYGPSTNREQGGSIIEREKIGIGFDGDQWIAKYAIGDGSWQSGPDPLIAGMRCFVKSRLGEEVEIPEALK